jgi:hypothetical protein
MNILDFYSVNNLMNQRIRRGIVELDFESLALSISKNVKIELGKCKEILKQSDSLTILKCLK